MFICYVIVVSEYFSFRTVLNIHTFHDSFTQVLRKFVFKFLVTAAIKLSVDKM